MRHFVVDITLVMKNSLKILIVFCFPILIQCGSEKEEDRKHNESETFSKITKNMILKVPYLVMSLNGKKAR